MVLGYSIDALLGGEFVRASAEMPFAVTVRAKRNGVLDRVIAVLGERYTVVYL